jgi:hypothetical protein
MSNITQLPYRLDISTINIDPLITTAVLEDKYTNSSTALDLTTVNSYNFIADANAASRAADRFRIIFNVAGVVPVNFVAVSAAQAGKKIAVEWNVANQLNIIKYEIEKSADGHSFTKVGTVNAANISTYNWTDENAVSGANFYRIKAIDANGGNKYTEIVTVVINKGGAVSVLPNPVKNNTFIISFNEQAPGSYDVRLINISGQVVYKTTLQNNGSNQAVQLPAQVVKGIYNLQLTNGADKTITETVIIE